jgi:deoxyribonuclease-1
MPMHCARRERTPGWSGSGWFGIGCLGPNRCGLVSISVLAALALSLVLLPAGGAAAWDWNAVSLSDTVVSFGAVTTGESHSLSLTITNNLAVPVQVLGAAFDEAIFSTDLAGLTPLEIPALGSQGFHVYFISEQNVDYTDFLRIEVDTGERPLVAEISAQAQYPDAYYASTQNKWAEELKDALTDLIDGHTALGYNLARDSMYASIDNVDGWVECVYTGRTAYFNTRAGATANGFNCEHTWPQSFSDEAEPMKSDIFHLYPTDETANNRRGNLDFGVVTTVTWTAGGSKLGTDAQGQQVFEPRNAHKGNVARTHFYYVVRYNGAYNEYVNATKMETHLRAWHVSDPADSAERARNQHIYTLQHNRNPFIDHPELVDRISSFFGTATRDLAPEIAVAPVAVDMDTVGFDSTACYYVAVANTGTDTLHVSSVTSTNPAFDVSVGSLVIAPEAYDYLEVTYEAGGTALADTAHLVLASDDADEGTLAIPLAIQVAAAAGVGTGDTGEPGLPGGVRLDQNRPNPFGRTTTLTFDLDRARSVDLAVYNINGQLVREVLRGQALPAGRHVVAFDAGGLTPGMYYYRLVAGDLVLARSMVLVSSPDR